MNKTKVIFRRWRSNGDILALFPELPSDTSGQNCMSYEHVGQHGGASPDLVQAHTSPANPDEYKALQNELTALGYDLLIVRRFSSKDYQTRREAVRGYLRTFAGDRKNRR